MMRKIITELRDDTSLILLEMKNPRVNAIFSSHLRKHVVSMAGMVVRDKVKKLMGFHKIGIFNIIVDVDEEIYKNVFIKEIIKIRFFGDCCDIIDGGDCFSVFWRNQKERKRSLRIYFDDGTILEFSRTGHELKTLNDGNLRGSLKNGK